MNRWLLLLLAIPLAAPCACKFNPKIDANGFRCDSADDCPSGYTCAKPLGEARGVCCDNKDAAACLGAGGSSGGATTTTGNSTGQTDADPAGGHPEADAAIPVSEDARSLLGGNGGGVGGQGGAGGQVGTSPGGAAGGTTISTTVVGSAGIPATGGTPGSTVATGGASITGGAASTGGVTALAGTSGVAGRTVRGGTTSVGGTVASGGTSTPTSKASPGCGLPRTGSASPVKYAITDSSGNPRSYLVKLPTRYDANKPYPVFFEYHVAGGTPTQALSQFFGIEKSFPDAIYAAPQGLGDSSSATATWTNLNGRDIDLTRLMLADLKAQYCIDSERIFAVGMNAGALMSYTIACQLGDLFRAVAPIAGLLSTPISCTSGRATAIWAVHGITDTVIPIASGRQARDVIAKMNTCGPTSSAVTPSPCVKYEGCAQGYDVTWCEWEGGHELPSFAQQGLADFFKQF